MLGRPVLGHHGQGLGQLVSAVLRNSLSGVMQALNDGGCTYTLGPQKGSTVSNNFCTTDAAPVVGCFYRKFELY